MAKHDMQNEVIQGFRLSPQQRRLWALQQSDWSQAYRVQCIVRIGGQLDRETFAASVRRVVSRHEILRTKFHLLPGATLPVQVIEENHAQPVEYEDLSGLSAAEQDSRCEGFFHELPGYVNDEQGTPLRVRLYKLSESAHDLILNFPSLCGDITSLQNFVRELSESYRAAETEDVEVQYADVAEWQNHLLENEESQASREYWKQQNWPRLDAYRLSFEHQPGELSSFNPQVFALQLPGATATKLEELAKRCEASVPVVLLGLWQVLFRRLTGAGEGITGVAYAGRNYEGLEDSLGLFTKLLPIRTQFDGETQLDDLLKRLKTTTSNAENWQEYFDWEAAFEAEENAFFPICYEYMREQSRKEERAPRFQLRRLFACSDRYKLKLFCREVDGGGLELELHYDASRFAETDVERLGEQYVTVVESAVAQGGQVAVSRLETVGERERARLVEEFNRTEVDYGPTQCVHELIAAQARRTPETAALVFENERLSYAELNARANQLAHYLRRCGVGPESLVGILMERSVELVVGLLGVLKAGAAYVPLDPGYPAERLRGMIDDAAISVVLIDESQRAQESWLVDEQKAQVVYLNNDWSTIANEIQENPISDANARNLAYALFTSGSTGRPKSVGIEHRQLFNYVKTIIEKLSLPAGAGFAMVSTFAADLGNTVLYPSLCTGGTLHVISRDRAADAVALSDYFRLHQIDCLKIVPSHLDALMSCAQPADLLPCRCLVLGGETAYWERVARIRALAPSCRVINHYGPTETTVGVLTRDAEQTIPSYSATVPLGRPLGNIKAYVLDEHLNLAPTGAPGEIYLGGAGVSRGYLFRPELTAEKFIPDRFNLEPGRRLYKTGDLGRHLPGGEIEFLGRIDHQVKLHGFRIELGEIEAALAAHDSIAESLVLMREDNGEQRLVAYVVARELDHANLTSELREFLRERVPEYMVPSFFVTLDQMPLTTNGKIDRARLPAPDQAQSDNRKPFVAPRTPLEEMLAGIWSERLSVARVGVEDNFFDLGGHSLLAMQLISQLHELFRVELPLRSIFAAPTITQMAAEMIARETKPGQVEKIAAALKRIKRMSADDVSEILQKKKRVSNS